MRKEHLIQTIGVLVLMTTASVIALADGKTVYESKCAMCHAKDGKGNPAMSKMLGATTGLDLTKKSTQDTPAAKLIDIISNGQGKMKGIMGVSATQATDVIAYIKTLGGAAGPKAVAAGASTGINADQLYKMKCAACHAVSGKGNAAMATAMKLEPGKLDLTSKATTDKSDADLEKITSDGSGKMPSYKGKLSDTEIKALTPYIRQLSSK